MTDRHVTGARRDGDGDVVALCGSWGTVDKETALHEIQSGMHQYFILLGGLRVAITGAPGYRGAHLRTAGGMTTRNGLADLPAC